MAHAYLICGSMLVVPVARVAARGWGCGAVAGAQWGAPAVVCVGRVLLVGECCGVGGVGVLGVALAAPSVHGDEGAGDASAVWGGGVDAEVDRDECCLGGVEALHELA